MHFGDGHFGDSLLTLQPTMKGSSRKWMLGFQQLLHLTISTGTFTRMKIVQTTINVFNPLSVETEIAWVLMGLDLQICCPSVSSHAGPAGFHKTHIQ